MTQEGVAWHNARQKRITASRAYYLLTYLDNKNPDWNKKVEEYMQPRSFSTPAMQYGKDTEKLARKSYAKKMQVEVTCLGFIVNPKIPWLGYSPDGFIENKNKLIEIKCPFAGKMKPLFEVLNTINYIDKNFSLKKNHPYYLQIQIGMLIFNCQKCDFIIYGSKNDECFVQEIDFDEQYTATAIKKLESIYFKYLFPKIFQQFK